MKNNFKTSFLSLLAFLISVGMYAQTITGIVVSEDGPLPGATVQVKDTDNGTSTDFDGNYSIEASSGDVLVISFVGFATQEIAVGDQDQINVTLAADSALDEIIVTGYRSQARGSITGSVATVDVGEAVKVPVANAAEALQGRVAGLTVTNSGQPGAAPVVRVRGYGTPNNNDPLYVIDGVQTQDAFVLNSINPQDIENISVLKDGSAAIYGARASNGVILITTKNGRGTSGTKVSVNASYGIANATNLPTLLTAQQHGDMLWQSYANDGLQPNHVQYGSGANAVVPQFIQGNTRGNVVKVNPNGTDWFDAIFDPGAVSDINVSISNGSENSNFLFNVNHTEREGTIPNSGYERYGIRLNSEFRAGIFTFGQHLAATTDKEQAHGSFTQEAMRMSPLVPLREEDGDLAGIYVTSNNLGNSDNPYATHMRAADDYNKSTRIIGDVYTAIDLGGILENLSFKTTFGGQTRTFMRRAFADYTPEGETNSGGNLNEQSFNQYEWTWTNVLSYNATIGDHAFDILAGYEAIKGYIKGMDINRNQFLFDSPSFVVLSTGTGTPDVSGYENMNTLASQFVNMSYSYKRKYLFSGGLRQDVSSRFDKQYADDIFPNVSLGWVIDKEDFFSSSLINNLKLRASYGEIGNQSLNASNPDVNISALNESTAFYSFTGARGNVTSGAALSSVGNPALTWETSVSTNIGLDFSILDSKFSGSVDYFVMTTKDLIVQDTSVIGTTAIDASAPYVNAGEVENKGYEFVLQYQNETSGGFGYSLDFNLASYKNMVNSTVNDAFQVGTGFREGAVTRFMPGEPISVFYGKPHDGLTSNGRLNFLDANGDGVTDDSDRTVIGSPHPDFTFGLNGNFTYRNWDASLFFQGSQGNDIYNWVKIFTHFPTFVHGGRTDAVLNSWTPTNTNTDQPALSMSVQNAETQPNSFFVEDGSYIRLKTLQLGYTIPSDALAASGLGSIDMLRIYGTATNLFTITDYSGMDPEVAGRGPITIGVDEGTYPAPRIFSVGVQINF